MPLRCRLKHHKSIEFTVTEPREDSNGFIIDVNDRLRICIRCGRLWKKVYNSLIGDYWIRVSPVSKETYKYYLAQAMKERGASKEVEKIKDQLHTEMKKRDSESLKIYQELVRELKLLESGE